jgi:hypothetical protein
MALLNTRAVATLLGFFYDGGEVVVTDGVGWCLFTALRFARTVACQKFPQLFSQLFPQFPHL